MKKAAIDISTAKPPAKPTVKPTVKRTVKRKPKQPKPPVQPVFTPECQRILDLLALGSTVRAAAKAVGVARSTFYTWANKDKRLAEMSKRARGIHIADIDDALHEVDTDARALIHRIIVDDSIKPGTRLRAALSALNRKGPGWLPRELPPYEYGPQRETCSPFVVRPLGASPSESEPAEPGPSGSGHNLHSEAYVHLPAHDALPFTIPIGEQSEQTEPGPSGAGHTIHSEAYVHLPAHDSLPTGEQSEQTEPGASAAGHTIHSEAYVHLPAHDSLPFSIPASAPSEPTEPGASAAGHTIHSETYVPSPAHVAIPVTIPTGARSELTEPGPSGAGHTRDTDSIVPLPACNALPVTIQTGEQSDAAKNSPGPTVAALIQPPEQTDTRHLAPDTSAKRDAADSVQCVQLPTKAHIPIQLTANQSLPTISATTNDNAKITESVQDVQSHHPRESNSTTDDPQQHGTGIAQSEPGASAAGHTDDSEPNRESPSCQPMPASPPPSTESRPPIASEAMRDTREAKNTSEARPPQPRLTEDTPGPTVAASIQSPEQTDTRHLAPDTSAKRDGAMRLDTAFFSKYTVLRHENPKDFAHLLAELTSIYEPQAQAEELQVLRMAQAHWNLRRIDTMQTAVLDSTVDQIRSTIPEANPAAAIASKFLGKEASDQVWFLDRMHHYRKFHDEYLARQEALLFRYKEAGEVSALRQAKAKLIATQARPSGTGLPNRTLALDEIGESSFRASLAAQTFTWERALADEEQGKR